MLRIGMLTSGGDCQALNAAMRGIFKGITRNTTEPVEFYGFEDGYKGLMNSRFRLLTEDDFANILTVGGTILGTSRVPFKTIHDPLPDGRDKVASMKQTYYKLQLDCLVVLGGNGSVKTANLLSQEGLNIITLPKTIDNDLWGTDMTFGFQSAVDIATRCIDEIHTTASAHGRVFIVEVMGHKVGWLTLNAGIAGGADIILLPEIPYDLNNIVNVIENRDRNGKPTDILGTRVDITNERMRQLRIQDSMIRYQAVFNSAMIDMVVYDADGYIVDMNDKALNSLHMSRGDLIQEHIHLRSVLGMDDIDLNTFEPLYITQIFPLGD